MVMSPVAHVGGPVQQVVQVGTPVVARSFQSVGHPMVIARPVPVLRVPGQTLAMSALPS